MSSGIPVMPLVGEELAGYRLQRVLGRGGMSVVFGAEHTRLGSTVALKVIAPELASNDLFRTRFLHESRTAASLNHPHVIPIYDTGPCGGLLYISMRYVSGADLRAVLHAHRRLSPDQAILLVGQAGRGLDAAHRAGLVHRDVKPANILIEQGAEDEPDHVYLADFGISKNALSRSGLTNTGEFVGTIDYIAPEQIKGERVDGRTDIYSLACVLFECLTGRVPFEKEIDAAVIWAHVEETPALPTSINPDLPRPIDDVLARGLAKNPDDRYSTCREFLGAARGALHRTLRYATPAEADARGGPKTVLTGAAAPQLPAEGLRDDSTARTRISARPAVGRDDSARRAEDIGSASFPPSGSGTGIADRAASAESHVPPPPGRYPPSGRLRDLEPPRRRRRPVGLIAASLVALVIAGGAIALLSRRSSSGGAHSSSSSSAAAMAPKKAQNAILVALAQLNAHSKTAKHLIPPSSCKAEDTSMATCTDPHYGVSKVTFQTFASLHALYSKYVAEARSLSGGRFKPNVADCNLHETAGEVSWNHNFKHLHKYSVAQVEAGRLSETDAAAGRVFCTFANSTYVLVWTQNAGNLLGVLTGAPHEDAWLWWYKVHHEIALSSSSTGMKMKH